MSWSAVFESEMQEPSNTMGQKIGSEIGHFGIKSITLQGFIIHWKVTCDLKFHPKTFCYCFGGRTISPEYAHKEFLDCLSEKTSASITTTFRTYLSEFFMIGRRAVTRMHLIKCTSFSVSACCHFAICRVSHAGLEKHFLSFAANGQRPISVLPVS